MLVGVILVVMGLVEVVRKLRPGNFFVSKDFSSVYDVMRLQELNRRIRDDVNETVVNGRSCYQIFNILASTRFRSMPEPGILVLKDRTWNRARENALKSAKRGYQDCERFLKVTMDSSVLILREAFAYSVEICLNCPILTGKPSQINQCPICENLKTEEVER
jgi:hypothetical protein